MASVSTVTNNSNFLVTLKKAANTYANFTFGVGQDSVFTESLQHSIKERGLNNFGTSVSKAYKDSNLGGSFFQSVKDAFTPELVRKEWTQLQKEIVHTKALKAGEKAAEEAAAKGLRKAAVKKAQQEAIKVAEGTIKAGKCRTLGKFLFKRMPLIGNAIMVVTEAPNIINAFTDTKNGGGFFTGIKEVGKTALKLGAFALGSAIGGAVPVPGLNFVTSIVGGMALGWVADKVLGKSFTEQRDEKLAAKAPQQQQQQQQAPANSNAKADATETIAARVAAANQNIFADQNKRSFYPQSSTQDLMHKDFWAMSAGLA